MANTPAIDSLPRVLPDLWVDRPPYDWRLWAAPQAAVIGFVGAVVLVELARRAAAEGSRRECRSNLMMSFSALLWGYGFAVLDGGWTAVGCVLFIGAVRYRNRLWPWGDEQGRKPGR